MKLKLTLLISAAIISTVKLNANIDEERGIFARASVSPQQQIKALQIETPQDSSTEVPLERLPIARKQTKTADLSSTMTWALMSENTRKKYTKVAEFLDDLRSIFRGSKKIEESFIKFFDSRYANLAPQGKRLITDVFNEYKNKYRYNSLTQAQQDTFYKFINKFIQNNKL